MIMLMIPARMAYVLTGSGLDVNRCARGGLRPARVDHDQLHATAQRSPRFCAGFCPGMPIALDTSGLVPISIQLSASWKSMSPPSQ